MKRILSLTLIAVFLVSNVSYAWPHMGHREYSHHGWGHERYEYRNGGWWFAGALVTGLTIGAIVASLPPRHDVVYVSGTPYYYDGTYYYQTVNSGYVVVQPPPAVISVPPVQEVVVPKDFVPVSHRGIQYYIHNDTWYIYDGKSFVTVADPTK